MEIEEVVHCRTVKEFFLFFDNYCEEHKIVDKEEKRRLYWRLFYFWKEHIISLDSNHVFPDSWRAMGKGNY